MFHPPYESRRDRAEAERLELFWRSWPRDSVSSAAWLGLVLAELLFGLNPPWSRRRDRPIPVAMALRQARHPADCEAAND
ncbi:hypothetical protein [Phenylobacterium aquaticum]|uniref:hypothetical protein n=1 Tax=Phenylobacterium aquaticum TaxID=1763816 RepID=UPI0026EF7D5E|nr:hypothetical protein [Phenylobacterium aquaticum]